MVSVLTATVRKSNRPSLFLVGTFLLHPSSFLWSSSPGTTACSAFRPPLVPASAFTSSAGYPNEKQRHALRDIHLLNSQRKASTLATSKTSSAFERENMFSANNLEMEYNAKVLQTGKYGHLAEVSLEQLPKKTSSMRLGEELTVHQRVLDTIQVGAKDEPILSLHRFKVWWLRPNFQHPVPPETLFILENVGGDNFRLILPVVLPRQDGHNYASASLRGRLVEGQDHEELVLCGNKDEAGLYVGVSDDPYALIQEAVTLATRLWESKRTPPAVTTRLAPTNNVALEKLGWCTWNAFYTALDGPKVVDAIRTLQEKHDIPIRWMILDDGWQHITERSPPATTDFSSSAVTDIERTLDGNQWTQALESFREDPKKFHAQDLKETVRQLHEDLGMRAVWVWHTLAGYWMGVNSESEAFSDNASAQSKVQYPHFPPGILDNDASASMEASVAEGIGITTDARGFFKQYHTDYLSNICGVDGVKVDAQGVVGVLQQEKWTDDHESSAHDGSTEAPVLRLHNALAESVQNNFATAHPQNGPDVQQSPSIIHCMAHAPEIFYRLPALYQRESDNNLQQLPLYRAADDFYPDNNDSHGPQVVACAYNSLLFQHVAIPDWDMFTTSTEVDPAVLRYHAVARCLSGGPIYFSSSPADLLKYEERPAWIDWISCKDGTTLPCRGTALPAASCLLRDPLVPGAAPMVLWNTNGGGDSETDIQKIDGSRITNGVFGVLHLAGSGKWDYKRLNYVPNSEGLQEEPKSVHLRPSAIPFFKDSDTPFLALSFFSQAVRELESAHAAMSLILEPRGSEVVTVYPIEHHVLMADGKKSLDVIPIGLEGMINGGGAVLDVETSGTSMDLKIRGCGSLLLAVRASGGGHASDLVDDVGVSVEVNKKAITTRHTFASDSRPQAASEAGLPSSVSLRKNLVKAGFDMLVVDIPDTGVTTEEKSEKPQLEHVKLDFSG